jgi:hypothetical protein
VILSGSIAAGPSPTSADVDSDTWVGRTIAAGSTGGRCTMTPSPECSRPPGELFPVTTVTKPDRFAKGGCRKMRTFVIVSVVALLLPAAAAAHLPFKQGKESARTMARALNTATAWDDVTCVYRAPHIRCQGLLLMIPRSDAWYRFTMTVHKTSAHRGFGLTCVTAFGVCKRQSLTF